MVFRSRSIRIALPALLLAAAAPFLHSVEVQSHGLWFEHWLCDTFFGGYRAQGYTQKWDIPANVNLDHGGLPVNPKAIKYGTSIGFGDALRQFEIAEGGESFLLIVGFWEQSGPASKTWVNVQAVKVTPVQWRGLWHPVTRADLEKLDRVIKDKTLTLEEARRRAAAIKSAPPFSEAVMQVNPKIDSSQRRLQCSLGFAAFFDRLAAGASRERQQQPALWGRTIPEVPNAPARNATAP